MNVHVAAVFAAAALTLLGTNASAEVSGPVSSYDKVLVDEIELAYDAASPLKALNGAERKRLCDAMRAALTSAAAGRFTIVAEPEPGVIRLHATIAGIDAAKKDKHFWRFTPIGLIKSRVDAASGTDVVVRAATIEVSAFDALSGERLPGGARSSDSKSAIAVLQGDAAAAPVAVSSLRELAATLEAEARRVFVEASTRARADAGPDGARGRDDALARR